MGAKQYTVLGSSDLEEKISSHMCLISHRLIECLKEENVVSLILMGGYGRGEGAVLIKDGCEDVFNDYDFFVVTTNRLNSEERESLKFLERELSKETGIDVDLYPVSHKEFLRFPNSIMNYEMREKSIIPYGDQSILAQLPRYDAKEIPLCEGTRLLLNRGILLLYCKKALEENPTPDQKEVEKIIKYIFKSLLALGDSYLLLSNRYHFSYLKKKEDILDIDQKQVLPWLDQMIYSYREACDFKLKVNYEQYADRNLKQWLDRSIKLLEIYYKWFEEQRLKKQLYNWQDYQLAVLNDSFDEGYMRKIKNVAVNLRTFGFKHVLSHPYWAFCYPRYRLCALLPLMLFKEKNAYSSGAFLINQDSHCEFRQMFDSYWKTWLRYS